MKTLIKLLIGVLLIMIFVKILMAPMTKGFFGNAFSLAICIGASALFVAAIIIYKIFRGKK